MTVRTVGIVSSFLLALAAAGCSGADDNAEESEVLDDWYDESERILVLKLGAPDSVYEMKDGGRILTWRRVRTENRGGEIHTVPETRIVDGEKVVVPIISQTPIVTQRYECLISFELDSDGYVIGYTAQGNDCIPPPPPD
jgi:hypothetical protein